MVLLAGVVAVHCFCLFCVCLLVLLRCFVSYMTIVLVVVLLGGLVCAMQLVTVLLFALGFVIT